MLRKDGYLHPVLLQGLGVILLVSFAAIWVVTGQESSLLVGAALVLIGMGSASGAIVSVRQEVRKTPDEVIREQDPTAGDYGRPYP